MKKLITIIFLLTNIIIGFSQEARKSTIRFQEELNKEFADPKTSPLDPKVIKKFKSLPFYADDSTYAVIADFTVLQDQEVFQMPTTTGETHDYIKYGEIRFSINGKEYNLSIYQSIRLKATKEYQNYLFLPFRDITNGTETYEGGRFIDLSIPEGNKINIDFNKAYNPSCAYSHRYACPITPLENTLALEIKAGVKYGQK